MFVLHERGATYENYRRFILSQDITLKQIPNYTFCPADKDILKLTTEVTNENNN